MRGDFTRSTFDPEKRYSSVRMQQGRVQLDADWNEQMDINLYRTEKEALDIIGPCGVPSGDCGGFEIKIDTTPGDENLIISKGRIYVDGILCENFKDIKITDQTDLPNYEKTFRSFGEGVYLAYLDVWQLHVTATEDPQIREVALGGPDTATRIKTVCQVKLEELEDYTEPPDEDGPIDCTVVDEKWVKITKKSEGMLNAFTEQEIPSNNPCIIPPGAGYRRLENQLYRVEIHNGGSFDEATFKWSRDNGSVVFPIEEYIKGPTESSTKKLRVKHLGRDKTLSLKAGDWVEVLDDARELSQSLSQSPAGTLVQITEEPNVAERIITLNDPVEVADMKFHPRIRRWDHKSESGAIPVKPLPPSDPIELEDGIFVRFSGNNFKAGDYWLIPARTATENTEETGKIEWSQDELNKDKSPDGIIHHYCRLAVVKQNSSKKWSIIGDYRKFFPAITELTSFFHVCGDGQEAMPGEELPVPLQVGVSNGKSPVENALVKFEIIAGGGELSAENPVSDIPLIVETDSEGVAECKWKLGPLDPNTDPNVQSRQLVEARLLDACHKPVYTPPIRFNANLSVASQVAYTLPDCATYETFSVVGVNYQYWSQEQYPEINLFGKKYTPLLASGKQIWECRVNKLAKLVLDKGDRETLRTGEKLDLGQGYTLEAKQVDPDNKEVWLQFNKNGEVVDDKIISAFNTWNVELDDIQGENGVVVLRVHVNDIFQGAVDSIAQIDGFWLIDYANAMTLEQDEKFGEFILKHIKGGESESNLGSLIFKQSNNAQSNKNIKTVQDALDLLICREPGGGGGCCVAVSNTDELKNALKELKEGSIICLLSGDFYTENIVIEKRRNIAIRGCTQASRLIANIEVINCQDMVIENLDISGNISIEKGKNFSLKRNKISNVEGQILKVTDCPGTVIESNIFNMGFGQGYILEAKQVDVDGEKVWLEFSKDGEFIDDEIIEVVTDESTWEVELDDIQDVDNVVVMRVHVDQIFEGAVSKAAQIDGLWLIDYKNVMTLEIGVKFGEFTLIGINEGTSESKPGSLVFKRTDSVDGSPEVEKHVIGVNYQYWFNEQYPVIDLFGEKYVPLLTNNNPIWKCRVDRLAKLVLDSNDKYILRNGEKEDKKGLVFERSGDLKIKNNILKMDLQNSNADGIIDGTFHSILVLDSANIDIKGNIIQTTSDKNLSDKTSLTGIWLEEARGDISVINNKVNAVNGPSLKIKSEGSVRVHGNTFKSMLGNMGRDSEERDNEENNRGEENIGSTVKITSPENQIIFTENLCNSHGVSEPLDNNSIHLISIKGRNTIFSNNNCSFTADSEEIFRETEHVFIYILPVGSSSFKGSAANVIGNRCSEYKRNEDLFRSIFVGKSRDVPEGVANKQAILLGNITTNKIEPENRVFNLIFS